MSHHPRLDLEHWSRVAPSPRPRPWWRRWLPPDAPPEIVHSAADVAELEQWRRNNPAAGRTSAADWFVWSTKPAEQPWLTRLGGIPHREADAPWPRDAAGQPYIFVGQICFLDSLDVVSRPLPGDVLLLFAASDTKGRDIDMLDLTVEWSTQKLRRALSPAEMPPPRVRIPVLSGVVHRTSEDWDKPTQGTKIGATTLFIQGDEWAEGSLLCALNFFAPHWPWPTLEHRALNRHQRAELGAFPLGDAGCIYVAWQETGGLLAWSDCY